jgi:hypothetical protein
MLYLKKFESFLNESINRAPLYHFTKSDKFLKIITEDLLKTNKPYLTHPDLPKESISLTRDKLFIQKSFSKYRIELDTDKLLAAGFKPIPIHEFNLSAKIDKIKFGSEIPDNFIPSNQQEERIYKSIPNIGKYIINIDVNNDYTILDIIKQLELHKDIQHYPIKEIIDFLLKYPNINLRQLLNWRLDKNMPPLNAKLINELIKA